MPNKFLATRWSLDLSNWSPTLKQLVQAVSVVHPEERERLIKFHFLNDFLSSLIGRLLMRKYVSKFSGLEYNQIKLHRDARGKPYWKQDMNQSSKKLSFNVSHQGDFVILAGVCGTAEEDSSENNADFGVGCDVMKLEYSGGKDLNEFFRIMHRKFSEHEWQYIGQPEFNQEQQLKAFMRHWCLKEAYVKEIGVGITVDLQKISFNVDKNQELCCNASKPLCGTTLKCYEVPMMDWYFEEHLLNPKYCAAIAYHNCKPNAEKFDLLNIDDLLPPTTPADMENNNSEILHYCRQVLQKQVK